MTKNRVGIFAMVGFLLASLSLTFKTEIADFYLLTQRDKKFLRVNDAYIQLEIVRQPEEWARGLMFREKIGDHEGMLFVSDREEPRSFWMKNTLISLDIIFISKEREVIQIAERTVPLSEESIPSGEPAQYILEIKGGQASNLGIRIGDKVKFLFNDKT